VLELPEGRGGGVGACAAVQLAPGAQLLGALDALRRDARAGIVVAIGVGAAGAEVFDALEETAAARMLGPQGPRFAAGAVLRAHGPAAFRAGTPPPVEERWADRAPHLCAALAPFFGPAGSGDCGSAFATDPPPQQTAQSR
jgi:hypothetical protein